MRCGLTLLIILFSTFASLAQKVGLVLSGGAAKGLAHIGVLKALEENEIPIDYIVGTSMGGIIGGCYAAGYSPNQIEELVLSEDFSYWINGKLDNKNNFFYNKNDPHPSFFRLNLSLDSLNTFQLNTSIASDISLNFALAEKFAAPSAIAKNNFDSLFIPLRVMASDIFTQNEVIIKKGILSSAMRATQTVPFFYNPIRFEGKYLYDGGVYNNFPVDVAQKEFNPDVIIGCNVSTKIYDEYPYDEDEQLISRSLLYMLLDKSDPKQVPSTGIYLQPDLKLFTAFDFSQARNIIDSGYAQTIRQMPEIKAKIAARVTCESVAAARNKFNNRAHPLRVSEIKFEGFNSRQQRYLNRFFKSGKRPLYFSDIKTGYYKVVSEDYFKSIYSNFTFDSLSQSFNFQLSKRPQNNFLVDFGGVIASRSISSIYLGLNYYYFNRLLTHTNLNFNTGNFYKSIQAKARIDFPNIGRFYLEPEGTVNTWDYLEGKDIVVKKFTPTVLNRIDRQIGMSVGVPVGSQYKAYIRGSYINNLDKYIDTKILVSTDTLDELKLSGYRAGFTLSTRTLNRKQYSSEGKSYQFSVDYFDLKEKIDYGTTSRLRNLSESHNRSWIQVKVSLEQYFKTGFYSSGYLLEGVLSNQPVFSNFTGTIINAPGFFPLQDSRTFLLKNFRAFNYAAGGWRNVFNLRKNLDFRLEGYVFKPLESIISNDLQEAVRDQEFTQIHLAATAGLVLHSTIGPLSLSVNYHDNDQNPLGLLFHAGFLLFNKTSIE